MVSLGDWRWKNNAKGYLFNSNGQPINTSGVVMARPDSISVNIKGIHVGNSAQTTAAIGIDYQILKEFQIGLDGNYFGRNFSQYKISFSNDPIHEPWMIPDAFTLDFSANYRFKVGTFDASLVGNIYNLLDNYYITDAFDGTDHTANTASVFYGFGRTWSLSLKIKF